jgi:hypothetical protein
MISPSFSLTATERVLPRMALDFTTASLDSRVTFTRTGNTATVVNSSGLIAPINADLPRFDFDPTTLVCKGLLIEEARTNLSLYSEDLTNVLWIKTGSTISANAILAPSGSVVADKIVEDTSTGVHSISQFIPIPTTSYSFSFFAKAAERSKISFAGGGFAGQGFAATFDLSNGTMFANTGGKATISPYPNGWYRCNVSFTASNGAIIAFNLVTDAGLGNYTGNGTSGVYFWGAQVEVGAFATSYIPTVASTVTRTADVASMTSTNFSSWYNATEGACTFAGLFITNANKETGSFRRLFAVSDGTTNNTMQNVALGTALLIRSEELIAGVFTAFSTVATPSTDFNYAFAYKAASQALAISGGTTATSTAAALPTVSQLNIGCAGGGTFQMCGWIKKLAFYPQRLINAEVQAFSK